MSSRSIENDFVAVKLLQHGFHGFNCFNKCQFFQSNYNKNGFKPEPNKTPGAILLLLLLLLLEGGVGFELIDFKTKT